MANTIELPINPTDVLLVPSQAEAREVAVYKDGQRTGEVQKDSAGRPLKRYSALVQHKGENLGEVSVISPEDAPEVEFGQTVTPKGTTALRVSNDRNGFNLRITLITEGTQSTARPKAGPQG